MVVILSTGNLTVNLYFVFLSTLLREYTPAVSTCCEETNSPVLNLVQIIVGLIPAPVIVGGNHTLPLITKLPKSSRCISCTFKTATLSPIVVPSNLNIRAQFISTLSASKFDATSLIINLLCIKKVS